MPPTRDYCFDAGHVLTFKLLAPLREDEGRTQQTVEAARPSELGEFGRAEWETRPALGFIPSAGVLQIVKSTEYLVRPQVKQRLFDIHQITLAGRSPCRPLIATHQSTAH